MKVGIAIALLVLIVSVGAVLLPAEFDAFAQEPPVIGVVDAATGLSTINRGNPYEPIPAGAFMVNVTLTVTTPQTNFFAFQVAIKYDATFVNCTAARMNRNDPSFIFYMKQPVMVTPLNVVGSNSAYVFWGATLFFARNLTAGQYLLGQANFTSYRAGASMLDIITIDETDPLATNPQYPDGSFLLDGNLHDIAFTTEDCQVNIRGTAYPPVALFSFYPTYPNPMQNVTFDAHASSDPDGAITSYQWDFGDNNSESTTSYTTTHVYTLSGTYNVTLTVIDDSGLSSSETHILQVEDVIPEHPSIFTLPLIVIATLSIIIFHKRNGKKKQPHFSLSHTFSDSAR